jgi:hypothetical protein
MQSRLANVALGCLKLGGAGYLLSLPLGNVSVAAGEATLGGSLTTMVIAGAVYKVADRRAMARLRSSAKQALARARTVDRPAGIAVAGGITIHQGEQQIY